MKKHLAIIAMLIVFVSIVSGQSFTKALAINGDARSLAEKLHEFIISKNTCRPGENLTISGNANPNDIVTISLRNPHGKVISTYSLPSDQTGAFSLSLKIPDDAIFGVWNVIVSDGETSSAKGLTVEYSSPLAQFKSGTDPKNTDCNPGLELVIKAEDSSPACVLADDALKLMKRHWAKEIINQSDLISNQIVGIVSIQMIPPYTPAGPTIQITIKNNEDKPITSLNAVLELYNNYTFDFANVTSTNPISPSSFASDTKTLIGGGFDSELPYPLVVSGVAGGVPFNFTENIHIPYTSEDMVANQTSQLEEFDGVIVDQSLDAIHSYSFYTNDTSEKFNIGSNGIWLEGLNNIDGLDGKHVKIFGTLMQVPHREDEIKVDRFQIIGSYVPKGNLPTNVTQQITLDDLYSNPDRYYNQTITISGQLREYDIPIAYAGVGCSSAQFTTNDAFVPDFVSRHQLYDGQNYIGVRIGGPQDVGYSPTDKLPPELKNKAVSVTGVFVPEIHDMGMCMHVLHKSGYILTDFSKINPMGG